MEDGNNRSKRTHRAWAYLTKRGRATEPSKDSERRRSLKSLLKFHNYDDEDFPTIDNNNEDTAPFDVAAFLDYLADQRHFDNKHSIDCNLVYDDLPCSCRPADNIGTHYYGDDCPGGHYNDEHVPDYNN